MGVGGGSLWVRETTLESLSDQVIHLLKKKNVFEANHIWWKYLGKYAFQT